MNSPFPPFKPQCYFKFGPNPSIPAESIYSAWILWTMPDNYQFDSVQRAASGPGVCVYDIVVRPITNDTEKVSPGDSLGIPTVRSYTELIHPVPVEPTDKFIVQIVVIENNTPSTKGATKIYFSDADDIDIGNSDSVV